MNDGRCQFVRLFFFFSFFRGRAVMTVDVLNCELADAISSIFLLGFCVSMCCLLSFLWCFACGRAVERADFWRVLNCVDVWAILVLLFCVFGLKCYQR